MSAAARRGDGFRRYRGADEIAVALNSKRPKVRLPGDNRELIRFRDGSRRRAEGNANFYRLFSTNAGGDQSQRPCCSMITPQAMRTMARHLVFFKEKKQEDPDGENVCHYDRENDDRRYRAGLWRAGVIDALPEIERAKIRSACRSCAATGGSSWRRLVISPTVGSHAR